MKKIYLIIASLILLFGQKASAEVTGDTCGNWIDYCENDAITVDFTWTPLQQEDINQIRSDCTLSSVSYNFQILGVGNHNTNLTSYAWEGLEQSTPYQWKVNANYTCTDPYNTGSISTIAYQFTSGTCNGAPGKILSEDMNIAWSNQCVYNSGIPTFHWTYTDQDNDPIGTDPQTAYEIRIDNDTDFTTNVLESSGGSSISYTPAITTWLNWEDLEFNTNYYWQVRVKDSNDNWSDWSDIDSFTTQRHTYPIPEFVHYPEYPAIDEEITFVDESVCYDSLNQEYSCNSKSTNRYLWNFGDGTTCDSNEDSLCRGNVTHSYESSAEYTVTLSITDDLGTCSNEGDTPLNTDFRLPDYKEVPPIIFLQRMITGIFFFPFYLIFT